MDGNMMPDGIRLGHTGARWRHQDLKRSMFYIIRQAHVVRLKKHLCFAEERSRCGRESYAAIPSTWVVIETCSLSSEEEITI
jgi:hypothetical protein